jgi:pyrimidine-nucleoside phosphorylase
MVDLIEKKKQGKSMSQEEINFMISGFTSGDIPDYQMSAWAMAVYFQGMKENETAWLTEAMVNSGETIDLSSIHGIKVDKHSTGGVGDTTTLVLAPLVASCGVPVAKMSGRGLGHTGGTIDKLEAFTGFSVELSNQRFVELVNQNNLAVVAQSANLTPADKALYALRDVTATVDIMSLIASSIMSKKLASGADAIVLDVKTGSGAFMKTAEAAIQLSRMMVGIGRALGRRTVAIISDMNQPLGHAVGNALEVKEAIDTLKGEGPKDLEALCLELGAHMLVLAEQTSSIEKAKLLLMDKIKSGEALNTFAQFIEAQGGNPAQVFNPNLLPQAQYQIELKAPQSGFLRQINTEAIGKLAMQLGAGRATKQDQIDSSAGLIIHKKLGDKVKKGEALATLHANKQVEESLLKKALDSFQMTKSDLATPKLIYDEIL